VLPRLRGSNDAQHPWECNSNVRSGSRTASKRLTRRFAQTQSKSRLWEAIQEMFVAGRPEICRISLLILRTRRTP